MQANDWLDPIGIDFFNGPDRDGVAAEIRSGISGFDDPNDEYRDRNSAAVQCVDDGLECRSTAGRFGWILGRTDQ